jgi:hypothetical protein
MIEIKDEEHWKVLNHENTEKKKEYCNKLKLPLSKRQWQMIFVAWKKTKNPKPVGIMRLMDCFSLSCYLQGYRKGKGWEFENSYK